MPAGRPTQFRQKYCQDVINHMKNGKSLASFARHIGTNRQRIWVWRKKYPEFEDACQTAQDMALAWWEDFAEEICMGKAYTRKDKDGKTLIPNSGMIQFVMSRRFKEYNQRNIIEDQTDEDLLNNNQSREEIEQEIAKRLERRARRKAPIPAADR